MNLRIKVLSVMSKGEKRKDVFNLKCPRIVFFLNWLIKYRIFIYSHYT